MLQSVDSVKAVSEDLSDSISSIIRFFFLQPIKLRTNPLYYIEAITQKLIRSMGSNYTYGGDGRINIGNEGGLSSSSSSSSRKGKKGGGGSDKPKQPQRGLGVAQLEKIRLHSQLTAAAASNYLPLHNPYHPPTFTQVLLIQLINFKKYIYIFI